MVNALGTSELLLSFLKNTSSSRTMAMERKMQGGPGDGIGGNRPERAGRVVRRRFRATVADGARVRDSISIALHGAERQREGLETVGEP